MIEKKVLNKLRKNYLSDSKNNVLNRIMYKSALVDLVTDSKDLLNYNFNIEIDTHSVTNQHSTGRCWSFAGLNILREQVIKKCNIDRFELSESYLAFFDKLERFNYYIEKLVEYKGRYYDRDVQSILSTGFDDGSTYTEFKELVLKYGVIPKDCYSNSFNSNDTVEINEILSRLIRKYFLEIENKKNIKTIKEKYLKNAYKILCNIYDVPPEIIDFEYTDTDGVYHVDKKLSPQQFYKKYINLDLENNYIEIYSYSDDKYKYNTLYCLNNSFINNTKTSILNLEYKRLEELIVKQLSNNELVYFSASTSPKYQNGIWIDLMKRYSDLFEVDLNMDNNSINKTYGTSGEHSMVITGVMYDKKVKRWKIENSWGAKEGLNGYFIAEPDYIKNYIISAVINKKYLNKNEKKIITKKPILVNKWDIKFC